MGFGVELSPRDMISMLCYRMVLIAGPCILYHCLANIVRSSSNCGYSEKRVGVAIHNYMVDLQVEMYAKTEGYYPS